MVIDYNQVLVRAGAMTAITGFVMLVGYLAVGHFVLETIYRSDISIVSRLLPGRAFTPLDSYLAALDTGVLWLAILLAASGLVIWAFGKNPLGPILTGCSLVLLSLAVFSFLEIFPQFIRPLRLEIIPYYAFRLSFVPDPVLGFQERPFQKLEIANFRGFAYSPVYGIDVPPHRITWATDEHGFRNPAAVSSADVVVIGSSFAEYGNDFQDTFPSRLEGKLNGLRVLNLGKAGYGPLQYVEVLKRYGIGKGPTYALLVLYLPADTDAHLARFVQTGERFTEDRRHVAFTRFWSRYHTMLRQSSKLLKSALWTGLETGFYKILGRDFVHPDVAVLKLPNNDTKKKLVFVDQHRAESPEELLGSPEWKQLEKIVTEFKQVSEDNGIIPFLVYIPAATEIYAEYSTAESGSHWLSWRDSSVATSRSHEAALKSLSQRLDIQLINLFPAYKQAAEGGKLVYYQLDSHWNAAGREIAAEVTAQALKTRAAIPNEGRADQNKREGW